MTCAMASGMFFCVTSPSAVAVDASAAVRAKPVNIFKDRDIRGASLRACEARKNIPHCWTLISRPRKCERLFFQFVTRLEHPPHGEQASGKEKQRHPDAHAMAHIGNLKKAPAETADQVHHWVEQRDRLPEWRQHAGGVERPAEEGQRRDDQ